MEINEARLFDMIGGIPLEYFQREVSADSFSIHINLDQLGRQRGISIATHTFDIRGGKKNIRGFVISINQGSIYKGIFVPNHGEHKERYAQILALYNKLLLLDAKKIRTIRSFIKGSTTQKGS